jgi:hypothetical protein
MSREKRHVYTFLTKLFLTSFIRPHPEGVLYEDSGQVQPLRHGGRSTVSWSIELHLILGVIWLLLWILAKKVQMDVSSGEEKISMKFLNIHSAPFDRVNS